MTEVIPAQVLWYALDLDAAPDDVSALVLPAEDEAELLEHLATRWTDVSWYGLRTGFSRDGTRPDGFAERYPGLADDPIAHADHVVLRGLRARTEWARVDPARDGFIDYYQAVRHSGGRGHAITIAPPEASVDAWCTATTPLVTQALAAAEGPTGVDHRPARRAAVATSLTDTARAGVAAVVPLTVHPLAGCLVVGATSWVTELSASLTGTVPGLAEASWEWLWGRGCLPAL